MLARTKSNQITGDDLAARVAALADILAIKGFKDIRHDVRARWAAAQAATAAAKRAYGEAARLHWDGHGEHPAVHAAAAAVERCMRDEAAAREAVRRAEEKAEADYLEIANKQINEALPVIEELTCVVADMLAALENLYLYGVRKRLPQPRLLDELVRLGPAWRFFVAAVNRRRRSS